MRVWFLNMDSRIRGNDRMWRFFALRALIPTLVIPANAGIQVQTIILPAPPISLFRNRIAFFA